jgi:hypothetical protein
MPTTRPSRSRSGPPEFPWLIGASVWIAFGIVRPFGDAMSRPTALTMPAVIVRSSPKGFPIAYVGSPTWSLDESSKVSGRSAACGASTLTTATSVEGSVPTIVAGYEAPFEKPTRIDCAPCTTCSFVAMSPCLSITNRSRASRPAPSRKEGDPGTIRVCVSVITTTEGASVR